MGKKEKVVYDRTRELRVWFYGGPEIIQLITYIVRIERNWLEKLFSKDKYKYIICQNNPCNVNAHSDLERAANGYIISIKSYEKALAMEWIIKNKYNDH